MQILRTLIHTVGLIIFSMAFILESSKAAEQAEPSQELMHTIRFLKNFGAVCPLNGQPEQIAAATRQQLDQFWNEIGSMPTHLSPRVYSDELERRVEESERLNHLTQVSLSPFFTFFFSQFESRGKLFGKAMLNILHDSSTPKNFEEHALSLIIAAKVSFASQSSDWKTEVAESLRDLAAKSNSESVRKTAAAELATFATATASCKSELENVQTPPNAKGSSN